MSESPRQSFLRNHDENMRLMRIAQRDAEEDGRVEDASRIKVIVDSWDRIGKTVEATR